MADDTIKSFLVGLGFKIDEGSEKKFKGALTGAVVAANLLSAAIIEAAKVVADSIRNMIVSFDQLYYTSARTGASVQNIKNLQYAFTQFGNSSQNATAAIESFAKAMRTNPATGVFIRNLGVKETGDAAKDLVASIKAIRSQNAYLPGSALAGILGISEEQYKFFDQYGDKLEAAAEQSDKIAKAFGLNSKAASQSTATFSRALGTLSLVAETAGLRLGQGLIPYFERFANAIERWVQTHPELIEKVFTAIGVAADVLAKAFAWLIDKGGELYDFLADKAAQMNADGSFLRTWERMAAIFDRVATAVKNAIQWLKELDRATDMSEGLNAIKKLLGWVEGKTSGFTDGGVAVAASLDRATDTGVGVPSDKAKPGLLRRGLNRVGRALGIGGGSDTHGSTAPIAGSKFKDKAPGVMKRLMEDFDLSKDEAAIVLGNLGHESAGFKAFEEGGGGPGRGWAQWTEPGRKRRFFEYAEKNKLDPKSDEANYGFLRWELRNTHKNAIASLKSGEGHGQKMYNFERDFEGAGVKAYSSRERYARDAAKAYDEAQGARGTPTAPNMPVPSFPKMPNMSPGGFDPNALGGAPLGSTGSSTSDSRSVHQTINNNVKIEGAGDPGAHAAHFERAAGRVGQLAMRDAQSAIS